MFVGKQIRQLDEKGRLAIPAEYLALLTGEDREALFIAPGKRGGLWLLPPTYYKGDFLQVAPRFDSVVPDEFFHDCQFRTLDKAGRIHIDADARALAGLADPAAPGPKVSVVICGSGRYLQMWSQAEYDAKHVSARVLSQNLPGSGNVFPGGAK